MTNIWDKVMYVRQFNALKKFEDISLELRKTLLGRKVQFYES